MQGGFWDMGDDWADAIAESDANPYRGCDAAFAGDDARTQSDDSYDELVAHTLSTIRE